SRRPLAVPLLLFSSSSYPDPRQLPAFPTRRSSDLLVDAVDEALGASSGPLRRPRHDRGHRHGRLRAPPPARPPRDDPPAAPLLRSEEHTSELQSRFDLVCRLLLDKKTKSAHHTTRQ